jgi:Phosphotransferase enzyme family
MSDALLPSNILPLSILPSNESVIFNDSSFFKHHAALPSPAEVRQVANSNSLFSSHEPNGAVLVPFPTLGLMVKYSRYTTIAEGQCLWAIRRILQTAVPVPEVFGWCRDGESTFIYMELIEGITLEKRWDTLSASERVEICEQLSHMVSAMRRLEQSPDEKFVGE